MSRPATTNPFARIRRSPSLEISTCDSPAVRSTPVLGHNASPVRRDAAACPPGLMKQLSRSFSATALATPRCAKEPSESFSRPPLARVDSPNLARVDSPTTMDVADREMAQHHDERKCSLKRFRSFGSASRLALEGGSSSTRSVATPSPLHFASRHRTGASTIDERAWRPPLLPSSSSSTTIRLGVDANDGEGAPPLNSIHAAWVEAKPAARQIPPPSILLMPPSRSGCRPPPILRPTSVESVDEMGLPSSPMACTGAVPQHAACELSLSRAPPLAPATLPPPPSLGLFASDDEEDSMAGKLPPSTPRCARAPAPTPRHAPASWHRGFHGRSPVPSMSLVAPGLYVGDEEAATSLPALLDAGITHVLNCTHRDVGKSLAGEPGAPRTCQLGLRDNSSDLPRMSAALTAGVAFIAEAIDSGGSVLVHCHRGISRSPTLAIAYLMQRRRQALDVVFEQMRERRPVIDPNLSYMIALQEWESRVLRSPDATPPSPVAAKGDQADVARGVRATPTTTVKPSGRAIRPLSRAG